MRLDSPTFWPRLGLQTFAFSLKVGMSKFLDIGCEVAVELKWTRDFKTSRGEKRANIEEPYQPWTGGPARKLPVPDSPIDRFILQPQSRTSLSEEIWQRFLARFHQAHHISAVCICSMDDVNSRQARESMIIAARKLS